MSFWKKTFGVKEAPKPPIATKKPARRDKPQVPVMRALPPPQNVGDLREGLVHSLIFEAARDGDVEQVKALFDGNPGLVITKDSYRGVTPLHVAAEKGKRNVVELLLAKGLHVNARNKVGATPLHLAAARGRRDVAELLLANRADVNVGNKYGATPLHLAAGKGNTEVVEVLLAKNADVNARDSNGATPLHYVASESYVGKFFLHKGATELLLAHYADVNAMDNERQSPLHLAAARGLCDMAKLLLISNANVNASTFGRTPLSYAALNGGSKDMEDLLRQHGGRMQANETAGR